MSAAEMPAPYGGARLAHGMLLAWLKASRALERCASRHGVLGFRTIVHKCAKSWEFLEKQLTLFTAEW